MENALAAIVMKMTELDYRDDEYRNRSKGNKMLGLQYFFKRKEGSPWEVYSSYNPHSGVLSMHYFEIYENEPRYPVFFIHIENDNDAAIACLLLEMKTNYLWSKDIKRVRYPSEQVNSKLRKMGFQHKGSENNIATWNITIAGKKHTLLIENSVSLSVYFFKDESKGKAKPLLSLRNVHEEKSLENVYLYLQSHLERSSAPKE